MRTIVRLLLFMWMLATLCVAPAWCAARGPLAPLNLRCEYAKNPVGIDVTKPRLSWEVNDPRRGAAQAAYQVLVSTTPDGLAKDQGDAWDTGKVESDQSIHVAYEGRAPESGKRYFWTVRTWDGTGAASPWSEAAWWEMGLLKPTDWGAAWITFSAPEPAPKPPAKPGLSGATWIWYPERAVGAPAAATRFFHRTVELPGDQVKSAQVCITADDRFTLSINGKEAGKSAEDGETWRQPAVFDVKAQLAQKGVNRLAIEARNQQGPAGVIAVLAVEFESGKRLTVATDKAWKTSERAEAGWQAAETLDERAWLPAKELGKFGCDPWGWVGEVKPPAGGRRSLCLRKEFRLPARPVRARAYVSGLGLYELYLNGKLVGRDVFTPGWTDYGRRTQYQTYDVADLLTAGDNAAGAVLGSGWWNGMNGSGSNRPRLILRLVAECPGQEPVVLVTDDSWQGHTSPVLEDSFYHGETYDARLETPGWDRPGFDAKEWGPASVLKDPVDRLIAQQGPTIQVTAELTAEKVTSPRPGVYVFDFGQNAAGRCRLKVAKAEPPPPKRYGGPPKSDEGGKGQRIQIRHAEVLRADGNIYTDNYRSARATDVYLCKGEGEEVWEPAFTYRGFRYAELTGYPGEPRNDALVFRVLHSAAPPAGKFECSNELINRVWKAIAWGQRSNMHSVPTDCPQRDERLGWTGDAQVFARTACWNMDMAGFFGKWMRDILYGGGGGVVTGGGPGWDDATVVLPWTLYGFYADRRIVEESYPRMVAYVEGRRKASKNNLFEQGGYGDWIAVVGSPGHTIGSAYYYHSVKLLSQMAAAIGKTDDAKKYAELAAQIAESFNAAYLDKAKNVYPGGTQTSFALPLYFGIAPADRKAALAGNLAADIVRRDYHPTTGFLGTPYLLPVLTDAGKHDVAYKLAAQKTYPSWGYMVEHGATTIWELWNSDKAGPGMNSRNHFALGSVGEWYFEALAGIHLDPERPGFKHIVIRAQPAGDLTWAKAEYPSMYGPISSAWKIEGGRFALDLLIPANTTATVYVPAKDAGSVTESGKPAERAEGVKFVRMDEPFAVFDVKAGRYSFAAGAAK